MFSVQQEIQYHIAYTLNELGRKDEAKNILTHIISSSNNFAEYESAKLLLTDLTT